MRILLTSVFLIAAALSIHLCWWRVRRPARATRSLGALFAGMAVAWLAALAVLTALGVPASALGAVSVWDVVYVLAFYVAMCLVYLITYIGIEAESPSVLILFAARRAGAQGLERADLSGVVSDEEMIDSRLLGMQQAGVVRCVGERYSLTRYGHAYLAFYLLPRFVMGVTRRGG
jgi:hypothetical protein